MKALNRRRFLSVTGFTAAAVAVPIKSQSVTSIFEAGAMLCLVLTVTATGVVCIVRLCRPRYVLYFSVNEDKPTNGGRDYICLSCSKSEAERRELTRCEGKFTDLRACQAKADWANTNYQAVACGPIASDPALRALVTLEMTETPKDAKSWTVAAPPQSMNLNDDDPSVTFTVPTSMKAMFFRAGAREIV